jgi:hypothetical protein
MGNKFIISEEVWAEDEGIEPVDEESPQPGEIGKVVGSVKAEAGWAFSLLWGERKHAHDAGIP